jgi:hypothetical protein
MLTPNIPQVQNSWQINSNNFSARFNNTLADNQDILFNIKNILVSFSSNPWTVVSSSNSVTASVGDNWNSSTDIVWSTGNHSWIVLQKPTTNTQILLSADRASSTELIIQWSPDGYFTGGTVSTDPTATDSITITSGGNWDGGQSSRYGFVHVWHTEDGSKTRIILSTDAGDPQGFWMFDEVTPLSDSWSHPEIVAFVSDVVSATSFGNNTGWTTYPPSPGFKIYNNSVDYNASLAPLVLDVVPSGFGGNSWHSIQDYNSQISAFIDDPSFSWSALLIYSDDTGARGAHAFLEDLFLSSDALESGVTFPNDSLNRRWAQFGHFVLPWIGGDTVPFANPSVTRLDLIDQTLNNNNGTLVNIDNEDIVFDIPGGSFSTASFNLDLSEYVDLGNVLGYDYTDAFSISAWFKTSAVSSLGCIVAKTSNTTPVGYEVKINFSSGEMIFQLLNDGVGEQMSVETISSSLNDGYWHHVVCTWDGNLAGGAAGANIYIDGYSETLNIISDNLSTSIVSVDSLNFGSRGNGFQTWDGNLDEISIWGKELTSNEVSQIYNNGNPDNVQLKSFASSYLDGFWRMGEDIYEVSSATTSTSDAYLIANISSPVISEVINYLMVGIDTGNPTQPAYHYWVVENSPDPNGLQAVGPNAPPFGGPLTNIYISATFGVIL